MTFLELAQMTTQQTGTIQSGTTIQPTTVAGQIDRLKQIIDYVREAYIDIQNAHRMWRWMQSRFTGQITAGERFYQGTDFTDERDGTPITRFSQWGIRRSGEDAGISMYANAIGPADEGRLRFLDIDTFYEVQARGVQTPDKPQYYTIDNTDRLVLSPIPNDSFTIRGPYRKSVQYLTADGDVPELPRDFHTVIKDAALCYIEGFDEGPRIPVYRLRMLPNFSMLEAQQLPKVTWGAPLA